MFGRENILMGKCLGGKISWQENVWAGKYFDGKMFGWKNILTENILVDFDRKVYFGKIVLPENCFGGKIFWRENIFAGISLEPIVKTKV